MPPCVQLLLEVDSVFPVTFPYLELIYVSVIICGELISDAPARGGLSFWPGLPTMAVVAT